jgi:hypothetical protein
MDFATSAWQVISAALVLCIGALVSLGAGRKFGASPRWALFLYLWHTIFCVFYANAVLQGGGDAVDYFEASLSEDSSFAVGTNGINFLAHVFSYYFGFSFLGVFFVFNIFGAIGLLAYDAVLRNVSRHSRLARRLALLLVLMPSVSFWSAALGKDSIAFMAASLALWASMALPRRAPMMVLAVLCMFLVRPHIAALLILAVAGSSVLASRTSWKWRALLAGTALAAAALAVPFALRYAGLGENGETSSVTEYVQVHQGYNQRGGGSIDVADMSLPMQLFSYVFRPLPYEANSGFGFAASLDNVLLLVLFVMGLWSMLPRRGRPPDRGRLENRTFLWLYSLAAWIMLAPLTANLGISVRQKWMFAPMLICLMLDAVARRRVANAGRSPGGRRPAATTKPLQAVEDGS